jgi:hypothetical protein
METNSSWEADITEADDADVVHGKCPETWVLKILVEVETNGVKTANPVYLVAAFMCE